MSEKKILTLVIIYGILIISTVLWFIVDSKNKNTNCWDNYTTEQEAIINCEE